MTAEAAPEYKVRKEYEGKYVILDDEGERVGSVGRFMPGPMVSYTGQHIMSPNHARAVARALRCLARDLTKEA